MKKTMKKTIFGLVFVMAVAMMASCSDDDDDETADPIRTDKTPANIEAVDLGLPSGTMWANMNIGAQKPEDFGLYFAWGETQGYTADSTDGRQFNRVHYKWCGEEDNTWSKYSGTNGDGKTVLDIEDDAAHINWGGGWVMPSVDDFKELLDNTTSELDTLSGGNARVFTSKINGNKIILPRAGFRMNTGYYFPANLGLYWSSVNDAEKPGMAKNLYGLQVGPDIGTYMRVWGLPIRPVVRKQ